VPRPSHIEIRQLAKFLIKSFVELRSEGEPFELDPPYEDVFYNEYLNLGFRTDKWAIPGALLRAKLREAEAAQLSKKGRERLTREEKAELKEFVVKRLKKQLAPITRVVDLSWSINVEPDFVGYRVYRSEQPDTKGQLLTTELLPTPAYRDTSVQPSRRYWYVVTAVDRAGNESTPSPPARVEIAQPLQ